MADRTHGVMVAPAPDEPSDEEIDAIAMRCCGALFRDVLHMTRAQRIAFARAVRSYGVEGRKS